MEEAEKHKNFIGYEYKEIIASDSQASFLLDGYENFGWEVDENLQTGTEGRNLSPRQKRVLRLKRNRKIVNKMELTRLQRNFEACVNEIEELEKSKTSAATMYSLIVGIIGTAFMAGSTFAVTAEPPHILWCILLAVPGFIGWCLPPFLHRKLVERQRKKITPLIEEKYDEIYEICEKGNKLLY